MGRNSSGNRISTVGDSGEKRLTAKNVESLVNIKDPRVYKEVKAAISRYHSALGARTKDVKIADIKKGIGGFWDGADNTIKLNKLYFNLPKKKADAVYENSAKKGLTTATNNRGISSIVMHELGHSTWSEYHKSANAIAATKSIRRVYDTWLKESSTTKKKMGYGSYAETNINEFFAETAMKAVSGSKDKYTRAIKTIVKKYKL